MWKTGFSLLEALVGSFLTWIKTWCQHKMGFYAQYDGSSHWDVFGEFWANFDTLQTPSDWHFIHGRQSIILLACPIIVNSKSWNCQTMNGMCLVITSNSQCKCIITVSINDWPMVVGPTHSPTLCFKWKTPAPQIVGTVLQAIYDQMGRALRQWTLSQTVVKCWHQLGHQVLQSHGQHYHLRHSNAYVWFGLWVLMLALIHFLQSLSPQCDWVGWKTTGIRNTSEWPRKLFKI